MKKKVMLKGKLLRISIVLIALFTATIYFVTDNKVNDLIDNSIEANVENISDMGLQILRSKHLGQWNVKDGELYLGDSMASKTYEILDKIKEKTGAFASVYSAGERVSTSLMDTDGRRVLGQSVSDNVVLKVIGRGVSYEETEEIDGKSYIVKYSPIRDKDENILGIWSVAVPKASLGNQGVQILAMRASIVVISILCGIIGCIILLLYTKKFLSDIDTLKVSFIGNNKSNNKTQNRVFGMSFLLIGIFFVIWFTIQGYTIGNVVNNIEADNMEYRLDTNAKLGYLLFDETYKGDWSIKGYNMYKGKSYLNKNSVMLDIINFGEGYFSAVYRGETSISTNALNEDGTMTTGIKAPKEITDIVLKQGKEYSGKTIVAGKESFVRYVPLNSSSGKTIGMWGVGVEEKIATGQIGNIRKAITQISLLAIIIAFAMFLYLSIKMVSDIKNFQVSLHTNIN